LRTWLGELVAQHDTLPDVTPQRLHPVAGLQGALALFEGDRPAARRAWQEVLEHESSADLFGQSAEVRVRFARLCLDDGDRDGAAALLQPLLARVDDGPRGAVFAAADLAVLAGGAWAGRLDDEKVATLRAWAAALALPAAATAGPGEPPLSRSGNGTAASSAPGSHLSARELEVIALIARGQSNKLIARALDLSPHTVKRHVANALDKLGVRRAAPRRPGTTRGRAETTGRRRWLRPSPRHGSFRSMWRHREVQILPPGPAVASYRWSRS
jgi:LuxR family maltose regulon positive regulatory protein